MASVVATSVSAVVAYAWIHTATWASRGRRGETEVRVHLPPGFAGTLYRAGDTLPDAARVGAAGADPIWLPEGRYFLEVNTGKEHRLFYPIPLGAGRGPDANGSFAVSVRAAPLAPPRRSGDWPPFVFVPAGQFELGDRRNPSCRHGDGDTSIAIGKDAETGRVDVEDSAAFFNEATLLELAEKFVHT